MGEGQGEGEKGQGGGDFRPFSESVYLDFFLRCNVLVNPGEIKKIHENFHFQVGIVNKVAGLLEGNLFKSNELDFRTKCEKSVNVYKYFQV